MRKSLARVVRSIPAVAVCASLGASAMAQQSPVTNQGYQSLFQELVVHRFAGRLYPVVTRNLVSVARTGQDTVHVYGETLAPVLRRGAKIDPSAHAALTGLLNSDYAAFVTELNAAVRRR